MISLHKNADMNHLSYFLAQRGLWIDILTWITNLEQ